MASSNILQPQGMAPLSNLDPASLSSQPSSPMMLSSSPPSINRLPVEILSNIFSVVLFNNKGDPCYDISRIIILGAVCSYWREITLKTASFWSRVVLDDTRKSPCEIASLCLERSGDGLLDFSVHLYGSADIDPMELLSNAYRVRSLSVFTTNLVPFHLALRRTITGSILKKGIPSLLQHLEINRKPNELGPFPSLTSWMLPRDSLCVSLCQMLFEQLHTLKLHGVEFSLPPCSFENLQTLELGKPCSIQALKGVLTTACNLVTLKLRLSETSFRGLEITRPKSSPPTSLKKLHISGSFIRFCTFLEFFSLGHHETEYESESSHFHHPHPSHLNAMRSVSTLVLTTLGTQPAEHLHTMLQYMPGVQTLVLRNLRLTKTRLLAMTTRGGNQTPKTEMLLFPRISCLDLQRCRVENTSALKALVNDHPITQFCVSGCVLKWGAGYVPIEPSSEAYKWLSDLTPELTPVVD